MMSAYDAATGIDCWQKGRYGRRHDSPVENTKTTSLMKSEQFKDEQGEAKEFNGKWRMMSINMEVYVAARRLQEISLSSYPFISRWWALFANRFCAWVKDLSTLCLSVCLSRLCVEFARYLIIKRGGLITSFFVFFFCCISPVISAHFFAWKKK